MMRYTVGIDPSHPKIIEKYCPYTELWRNIIWQAMRDVIAPIVKLLSADEGRTKTAVSERLFRYRMVESDRREAKDWIMGDNENFLITCDHAGFHPEIVRKATKKLMAEDGPYPIFKRRVTPIQV